MGDPSIPNSGRIPSAEAMAAARSELGDSDAAILPCLGAVTGRDEAIILLSERAADELAGALGYFGGPLAVAVYAAVTLTDLSAPEIARVTGVDEGHVGEEIGHLESGGFLYHQTVDGVAYFAAGNPPLKRYFAKRFAPGYRTHP